jgi:hypothetical protein
MPLSKSNLSRSCRHWTEIMFEDETIGVCSPDGLLFAVALEDVKDHLAKLPSDKEGWFFNSSRDRYCAAPWGFADIPAISINPGWAYRTFGQIVIG